MRSAPGTTIAQRLALCLIFAALILVTATTQARAVPAFAAQTGQPCQMCHVGGFGPQLTPYGRNFKLSGYTQRQTMFNVPISAMAIASYVHTQLAQDPAPADGFATNNNVALDQVSLFLAGGLGSHLGGFVQTTYDGVTKAWTWDNVDLRATTKTQVGGADVVLGLSLNNSPTVEDPWNTLGAWGFPYTDSALAPSPSAAPLLSGTLAQTSLGLTAYAWINSAVYVEAGAYGSPSAGTLRRFGADPDDPGDISGLAPYARVAYQKMALGGTAEVGAFGMRASIHPGRDRSTGLVDHYTDLGLDASFQKAMDKGDVVSVNARYTHERQSLEATCVLAGATQRDCDAHLNELRADVSYYWRGKVGLTVAGFDTFGGANPVIYAGNRTLKPDSSGVMFQIDATPFGDQPQPQRRPNIRVGLQYTLYSSFDGAANDFDGAGRKASDQNTLRIFTWLAF
jgi:hypothetical protein